MFFNNLNKINNKNKNRTFQMRTKHVQKNTICKNHIKKLETREKLNVSD